VTSAPASAAFETGLRDAGWKPASYPATQYGAFAKAVAERRRAQDPADGQSPGGDGSRSDPSAGFAAACDRVVE
jgi:hypothetical protein